MKPWVKRARSAQDEWDYQFVTWVSRHVDFFLALTCTTELFYGIARSQYSLVISIVLVGAISFFVGLVESIAITLLMLLFVFFHSVLVYHTLNVPFLVAASAGWLCVSWLGFHHREEQKNQKKRLLSVEWGHDQTASVLPWAVSNEIRTSLAAVRFLLFPLQSEEIIDDSAREMPIAKATHELQRLENLFMDYEEIIQEKTIHHGKVNQSSRKV
ncbi:hypothetical protein [Ferroacidibacillus organovorans]|uniref:Histidine kinase n=1 Tax=Ferroacidibacillus organovorans TaxID=1765683 RepID=A0A1V4ER78_9BACL|nr:hypothetical protein [Ferroacidibacillus organovorans]OPG15148.1 hypothetical protein B2M26_13430 [Ferroacidibacillus organovorans]